MYVGCVDLYFGGLIHHGASSLSITSRVVMALFAMGTVNKCHTSIDGTRGIFHGAHGMFPSRDPQNGTRKPAKFTSPAHMVLFSLSLLHSLAGHHRLHSKQNKATSLRDCTVGTLSSLPRMPLTPPLRGHPPIRSSVATVYDRKSAACHTSLCI